MPPTRTWYQFSLRTLLVTVTVFSVALGLLLLALAPFERQRLAVRRIEKLGGRVSYEARRGDESSAVRSLRDWLPRDYFDVISAVDLSGTQAGDAEAAELSRFTNLKTLYLGQTRLTDAGLAQLAGLTKLVELSLGDSPLTDAGLAHLRRYSELTTLDLHATAVTDEGLAQLQGLPNLRELDLRSTPVSDDGLATLLEFPGLTHLYLQGSRVSAAGESEFQKARRDCVVIR